MPRPAGIPDVQWRDWVWQMQERVRSAKDLERYVNPTDDERQAIDALAERFRFVITPYYASLMDPDDPACPIRKQVVPRTVELDDPAGLADPLDEVAHSPVKNVIRVYPDRIAFCVNNECALYCRFCLRKRMVGDEEWIMKKRELVPFQLVPTKRCGACRRLPRTRLRHPQRRVRRIRLERH